MFGIPDEKQRIAAELRAHLRRVRDLREAAKGDATHFAVRQALRAWQSRRLARTYADLLSSVRYGDAARFFLDDLYGAKDFSRRDVEVERIVPTLTRMLPAGALEVIARAIELDALSEQLDADMVAALPGPDFDDDTYAQAFRDATTRAMRERQLILIGGIGATLNRLVRLPLLPGALALMRGPAQVAGLSDLHEFLQRGLSAFRKMGDAATFLAIVQERERALMQAIFDRVPDPFGAANATDKR